jgi:hypothetical protein
LRQAVLFLKTETVTNETGYDKHPNPQGKSMALSPAGRAAGCAEIPASE